MKYKNLRMNRKKIAAFGISITAVAISAAQAASTVTGIDFKNSDTSSQLQITANGPITFEKQENAQDKQLIIELKGAKLSKAASRKVDTSSFNSKVSLISPYQVEGQTDTARIVVQLKDNVSADVTQEGNQIRVSIPNHGAEVTAGANADSSPSVAAAPVAAMENPPATPKAINEDASLPLTPSEVKLNKALEARDTGHFSGTPISLQVRDADINDVLRLISEASGFNIVVGDDVKGRITLSLSEVPWDQALDVVLRTLKLGAERNNNLLRVVTLASLTAEKQEELAAKKASMATAKTVTQIFPINYADINSLVTVLQGFGGQAGGNAAGAVSGGTFRVQIDSRTNSLIVQDVPESMEKIKKLISLLDTQTPQVLIEAKIIEASEGFAKQIGGSIGLGGQGANTYFAGFNGGNPLDPLIGSPGVFANGAGTTGTNPGNNSFGLSPSLSFIPGLQRLNALLSLAEVDNAIKVVSSPKMVVLNKQTATVTQSTPVASPQVSISNGVQTQSFNIQQANISLNVTPTVTNDGGVQLELKLQRGVPFNLGGGAGQAVADRKLETKVLVDTGSTLVIGGVYTMQTDHSSSGFPILRKIPILGVLFGSESDNTTRSELFFFITPKILNSHESGLGT